jgi:GT2 family glycosyltransferase
MVGSSTTLSACVGERWEAVVPRSLQSLGIGANLKSQVDDQTATTNHEHSVTRGPLVNRLETGPGQSTISVIVLSYNRPAALAESLVSILAQKVPGLEVIVVDNLSPNSAEVARVVAGFPGVRLIQQDGNYGFAAGMNRGLACASGEYIHLTEDDIILDTGFFEALLSYAKERPACLLSGVVYQRPGDECWFAGAVLEFGWRYVQRDLAPPQTLDPYPTGMLRGAMMFGRREVFLGLRGFREEFFLYFEDAEFSWRARQTGVRLWIVPAARAWHLAPEAYRFKPVVEQHKLINYLAINLLYMPLVPLIVVVAKYFLYTSVRKAVEGRDLVFLLRVWLAAMRVGPIYLSERFRLGLRRQGRKAWLGTDGSLGRVG